MVQEKWSQQSHLTYLQYSVQLDSGKHKNTSQGAKLISKAELVLPITTFKWYYSFCESTLQFDKYISEDIFIF